MSVNITINSGGNQGPNQMGGPNQMAQPKPFYQNPGGNPYQQQPMGYQQQPQPGFGQPMGYQQQPIGYQQPQQQPLYQQPVYQQPIQQGVFIPQPNINNRKKTGWDRLAERDGIFIKQKFDWQEAITGCEQENVYYVYPLSKGGEKKGNKLFECKEKSSCCARLCLSGECRPFQVSVNTVDKEFEDLDNEPFLNIDRPCMCTCYCLQRPEMTVKYVANGADEFVGKVIDPCQCGNIVLNLYNKSGSQAYVLEGSCCQMGLWCKCPCEPCQNIEFKIKTALGEELSEVKKKSPGCFISQISDADNFSVVFPTGCTKEDKAVIMASVIFLDFRHFEEQPGKRKGGDVIVINNGGDD